jgi:hypothetical protein
VNDEEAKKTILARRATFVAAALAGVGAGTACDSRPFACLEPPIATGATTSDAASTTPSTPPMPCLAYVPPPAVPDAGADAALDAEAGAAAPHHRDAGPKPCLYVE